jgi:hypothetical protein
LGRQLTGHVRQRITGLWEGQYTYKGEHRSIYGKTQEEVSRQLDEIIASIGEGKHNKSHGPVAAQWVHGLELLNLLLIYYFCRNRLLMRDKRALATKFLMLIIPFPALIFNSQSNKLDFPLVRLGSADFCVLIRTPESRISRKEKD